MPPSAFLFSIPPPTPLPFPPKLHSGISPNRISATQEHSENHRPPPPPPPDPIKIPAAPWMRGPLLLPADQLLSLSPTQKKKREADAKSGTDRSLTEKVRGGRSHQAMKGIVRSISRLRELRQIEEDEKVEEDEEEGVEFGVPLEQVKAAGGKAPWVRAEQRMVFPREKKERVVTAAEMVLSEPELARLRGEARGLRNWVKAKKAGVTSEVVEEIRRNWRTEELVKVKIVEPLRRNMDRAREIVETKTGGLVVWCKNDALVVYRGSNYHSTTKPVHGSTLAIDEEPSSSKLNAGISEDDIAYFSVKPNVITDGSTVQKEREGEHTQVTSMDWTFHTEAGSVNETLYEREANRLLDGLGPRFIDWWWRKPLPVDADLLPEVVPNFKPPFRLCPPRVRPNLSDDELTYLRKLALPLPTHFALGRNTKLQGLAAAIIKLWEKSLIAKIAVKVGIPGTNDQQMARELKHLTGGVLILRNKFFIILYRGKDFLPGRVANSVLKREKELHHQQLQEEEARSKAVELFHSIDESLPRTSIVGTFTEFCDIHANYLPLNTEICMSKVKIEAEKQKLEKELRDEEHKLFFLKRKIEKSEIELSKLNSLWYPSEQSADLELISQEERQSFLKLGLKMDEFLLLGRRGIYSGVIESIHQHWKHREVVKVITMQKTFPQITYTARLLEIESGGILVAVEKLRSGHAIIIYRGKNYKRPSNLLPENLLTKREALRRSIEIQRHGSMKYFAYQKQLTVLELKMRLRDLQRRAKELASDLHD